MPGAQAASSGVSVGGGGSAPSLPSGAQAWQDPDFCTPQWRQALEEDGVHFDGEQLDVHSVCWVLPRA